MPASDRGLTGEAFMVAKILVALDDSDAQTQVFQAALELAEQEQAQLLLLHILSTDERDQSPLTALAPYGSAQGHEGLAQCYEQRRQAAEVEGLSTLKNLAELARLHGVSAEWAQPIGNPRRLICYLAQYWGADLIMVGRRHLSWIDRWLSGSVSRSVRQHAPCPVRVVQ